MTKCFLGSLVLFAVLCVIPSASFAQKPDPEVVARIETDFMKKQLKLDSSTESVVHEINLKYEKENYRIMNSDISKVDKLKEIKQNSDAKDEEMKRVLSKDQYEKYIKLKKDLMKLAGEKMKENNEK